MIVLDTSVLSLVFRRKAKAAVDPPAALALRRMIADDWPLGIPGIVLQELLSGVRTPTQFSRPSSGPARHSRPFGRGNPPHSRGGSQQLVPASGRCMFRGSRLDCRHDYSGWRTAFHR